MLAVFALVAALLVALFASRTFPYLPRPLELSVVFPEGIAGRVEPLVSTGVYERADFVSVQYLSATTAVVRYDAWGPDGPASEPFSFTPGQRHSLVLETPDLDYGGVVRKREQRPARVVFDGREILHEPVFFYSRRPEHVYFAVNPIGGNTFGALFRGQLFSASGRRLAGGPESYFSFPRRLATFVTRHPLKLGAILLVSVAAGLLAPGTLGFLSRRVQTMRARPLVGRSVPPHRVFAAAAAVCVLLFTALLTQGSFRLLFAEPFGAFYDFQAASLLEGRLDVPPEAIGGEAFIVDGRHYGYFGITPAVLRLPFAITGIAFGELSRLYMLGYYAASLLAAYLLLCHATKLVTGRNAWPSAPATVVLTLAVGLGSSLFYLGARAYLYHEAILCGAMFAIWTVYFTFRYVAAPAARWWWAALACGLLAVHARPSSGLFALCVLGAGSVVQIWLAWRRGAHAEMPRHVGIGALAALAILSFNGMSYLKFGTFDGSPFRYSVQYTPERIARFEGKNFHLSNIPRNLDTYVLQPDFVLRPRFPFIYMEGGVDRSYPDARIDLSEPTLAFPYSMPALFGLAVLGGAWAFARSGALRPPLVVLVLGFTPMALALFSAIVTSHRYTGDFCPFFTTAAAMGLAVLDAEGRWIRRTALALSGLLTAAAIAVTFAVSLHFQGELVWGVPEDTQARYQALRNAVDGVFGLQK